MLVLDSSGKYEPGEGGWLSVAFKPTMEVCGDTVYYKNNTCRSLVTYSIFRVPTIEIPLFMF